MKLELSSQIVLTVKVIIVFLSICPYLSCIWLAQVDSPDDFDPEFQSESAEPAMAGPETAEPETARPSKLKDLSPELLLKIASFLPCEDLVSWQFDDKNILILQISKSRLGTYLGKSLKTDSYSKPGF